MRIHLFRINEDKDERTRAEIRRAPRERAWMESTADKYAYRCLPLAIANQHGWEIYFNSKVRVVWNGGNATEALKVISSTPNHHVSSNFGYGIVTFHTGHLIRTSPEYDLLVSGSPNHLKSGIQPLTGIIESSWSPYSFTMNWKITEIDRIIEFEAGEPFCFFFPVQRSLIEEAEVITVPLSADPSLEAEHNLFSKKRAEFRKLLDERKIVNRWQKDYFQGKMPSGVINTLGNPHRTKLKLKLTNIGDAGLREPGYMKSSTEKQRDCSMDFQTRPQAVEEENAAGEPSGLPLTPRDSKKAREIEAAARQTATRLGSAKKDEAPSNGFKLSRYDIPVALADGSVLLFNSHTRSLIVMSEAEASIYHGLAGGTFPAAKVPDPLLLQALVSGGHAVGADLDELALVRSAYESTRASPNSLSLTIAPTMACNFACGYCFQGLDKPTKKMTPEVQDAILAFVKAKKDLQSLNIVWYGGEPLMGKESIFKLSDSLIAYCDKKGIAYSAGIVSNAYFLTAEVAAQLYSRRITWVQVTIDGDRDTHNQMRPLTSGHGTYDRILENIGATLDATALSISVRVNVGQRNVDKASGMLDAFVEQNFARRGSFSVYFSAIEASTPESGSAFDEKLAKADFNKAVLALEEKARALGFAGIVTPSDGFMGMCVAASNGGYVISGNGDVHKCWETAHDPSKRTGTIFAPENLHGSVNANLWAQWSPFDNATCSSCKILPMCGGACAHRFIYGGPDQTALPCPSWKWNTAEYVFSRAKDLGVISQDMWLPGEATVLAKQSGERHSKESLADAQERVLEKISLLRNRKIDRDMLFAGESALEN